MDNYDKTKEYTKYVKPIVSELKKECGLNNIPFLFTAAIKNSESETVYKNEMLLAQTHVSLTDKRIARMLLRMNGFDTKLPESVTAAMKTLAEYLEVNAEPVSALDAPVICFFCGSVIVFRKPPKISPKRHQSFSLVSHR